MAADVTNLKIQTIHRFDEWLYEASYGHYRDYSMILHMISLVQVWNDIDNVEPIYEFLVNN
jgi:hypothetical protein